MIKNLNLKYFLTKNKFFLLTFNIKENLNNFSDLNSDFSEKIIAHENSKKVVLAGKLKNDLTNFVLFESPNEVIPKNFIDSLSFKKEKNISNFNIEEIEIVKNQESKDLVKIFSYLV